MPSAQVRAIALEGPRAPRSEGELNVRVTLEDGSETTVLACTPGRPASWVSGAEGFSFGRAALFVRALDEGAIGEGVRALAGELGGFWLRYYNAVGRAPKGGPPLPVASVALARTDPAGGPSGSAVVETKAEDGRVFSLLAATPAWFAQALAASGLRFYFGPCPLFLRTMDLASARKAVTAMAAEGDRWLCSHDTPRRTLPAVLDEFHSRHA